MVGAAALAAGIASRQGSVRLPPLRLTAVVVGATFAMTTSVMFLNYYLHFLPLFPFLLEEVLATLAEWTSRVAWLAILWLGISAWTRGRGQLGWKLVLLAGALNLASHMPGDVSLLFHQFVPIVSPVSMRGPLDTTIAFSPALLFDSPESLWQVFWQVVTAIGSSVALLLALVVGLRPVPSGDSTALEPEPAAGETAVEAAAAVAEPGAAGASVSGPSS
jgi:hypothetical protein